MNEVVLVPNNALSVSDSIDNKLIKLFIEMKKSENTRIQYTNSIRMFVEWFNKPLPEATLQDTHDYHTWLKGEYKSLHSIKLHINVMKSLYSFGIKANILFANPFAAIRYDTPAELSTERILTEYEVQQMFHAKEVSNRDMLLIKLLYVGGLRVGELCKLVWSDLSDNCVLHIRKGKGDKERFVTLPSSLCEAIVELQGDNTNESPIFKSQKGGHLDESAVHRIVKKIATRAGVNGDVSAHWLRHAHASHSIDRGAKLVTLRDTLGHASISTTNKYLHSKPGESSALSLQY